MSLNIIAVIGVVLALAATAATYIFIMPNKKRAKLPSFCKFMHDLFNFKTLMLEKIIKILYIFLTFGSIISGILLLFLASIFWGIVVMILGPVVIRVVFELIMMRIIEVQNVISINRKLKK